MQKNLLMVVGLGAVESLAQGKQSALFNTLEEFHNHWGRIDIVAPKIKHQTVGRIFDNVHIHSSNLPLLFHPFFFIAKIVSLHRLVHFDFMTVHEFPPFYNGIGARIVSALTGIPYILEIMHIPGVPHASGLKERFYRWLTKFFIAFDAGPARAVRIINQRQTGDFLVKAGVSRSKLIYIPAFYIDFSVFKPEPLEKKYDLVCAARLESNKGILNLLKAVKILCADKPDIKLGIIGDGPLRQQLEHYVQEHGLQSNVEFLGWLPGPRDIAQVFNSSRVFVSPSLNEGGPRVVLEAMACGIPVVTTFVGLMVDIIKDEENGLISSHHPQDLSLKIETMLQDSLLSERCVRAASETVKQFERSASLNYYAETLKKLSRKRLLVITQKVDQRDQLLGFFVEWLRRLGQETDLSVLCLEKGTFELPGISVTSLGKEKGNSRLVQLWNFYSYIIKNRGSYDSVLAHMNPIWVVLGGWYWRLVGKKVNLWYTSKGVTLKLRVAEIFAHQILTASKESFRVASKKVLVTGHGIDTDLFKPGLQASQDNSLLSVGRITAVKNYEVLVKAVKELEALDLNITIVGEPALLRDKKYQETLKSLINQEGLSERFAFIGKIGHSDLPKVYQSHRLFVHMSKTGSLDKAILEAMACGMTVISCNDAARAFLPLEYCFKEDSSQELAQAIKHGLDSPLNLRDYVVQNHNLNKLIAMIASLV